ncbi:MAG TPA: hypothetical protein PLG79_05990 [Spirochaetales bacterium]|nr:hypothetical protein [Spirochaetales bacterium]
MEKQYPEHRKSEAIPLLVTAGMQVPMLLCIFSLFFLPFGQPALPLLPSLVQFILSTGIARFLHKIRRRKIIDVIVYLGGCVGSGYFFLRMYPGLLFQSGLKEGLATLNSVLSGYLFCMILVQAGVFWHLGWSLGRKDCTHKRTLSRFDGGVGALLFVGFLQFVVKIEDSALFSYIILFFLFGLVALYSSKHRECDTSFRKSHSIVRWVVLFIGMFLFICAVSFILYPLFVHSANVLYENARNVMRPVYPYLIALIRFLLSFSFARPSKPMETPAPVPQESVAIGESPYWLQMLEKILGWGLLGVFIILGAILAGYMLIMVIRALLRSAGTGESFGSAFRSLLSEILIRLQRLINFFRNRLPASLSQFVHRMFPGKKQSAFFCLLRDRGLDTKVVDLVREVERSFRRLLFLGTVFRCKRRSNETLTEYGGRFTLRFPELSKEAMYILKFAEQFYYGSPSQWNTYAAHSRVLEESRSRLKSARRRLYNPGAWSK